MGEVVYLKTEAADLICLCPKWLCSTLCGYLLSRLGYHLSRLGYLLSRLGYLLSRLGYLLSR